MENMDQYKNQFENFLKNKYSQNTVNSYLADVSAFISYIESKNIENISAITKRHVSLYINEVLSSGKSTATAARHLAAIKLFFTVLISYGYIDKNPCEGVNPPKDNKKMPEILTEEEINLFLSSPDTSTLRGLRDKAMLELLYATGMKASEIISLKYKDVNLQMGYCICSSSEKNRLIPIGKKAIEAINSYLQNAHIEKGGFLFVKSNGSPITRQGFWKAIKHYGKEAGLDKEITPALLRHSFAAHMIFNGADISSIQEMLGLSNINSLDVYTKLNKKRILDVYNSCHPRA